MAFCGNCLIVVAITIGSGLQIPMCFFLVNLAMLDVICACTVLFKLLKILVVQDASISYRGCMVQMYFLTWSVAAEVLLFTAMAYDCYMFICQPLLYGSMMSSRVCAVLAGVLLSYSFMNDIIIFVADIFLANLNFLLAMVSYGLVTTILKICTAEGKQ
ncbi:Olfactory receptor 13A1 [Tupaia chinensis]|uniref:Olfactory receptor 13A1 n=1 Tax=Tupaia chinensis TaxID=246437 RepID=L9L1R7_TUPCH|nr:Olfactory receptor 13A1 [Tupaia chinensis]